jgi:hypothetical protein
LKIITRGEGKSAVSAAAYRSGSKLHSEYDGTDHDYTRKGGVVHTEILLPDQRAARVCRPLYPAERRREN